MKIIRSIDIEKVLKRSEYQTRIDLFKKSLRSLEDGRKVILHYVKDLMLHIIRAEIIWGKDDYLVVGLKYYVEVGLAHFERCCSSTSSIKIQIGERSYEIEKEMSPYGYNSVEWVKLMCSTFILRDRKLTSRLCSFEIWNDLEFDSKFHNLFANYLVSVLEKNDSERKKLLVLLKEDSESDIGLFVGNNESKYMTVQGRSELTKVLFFPLVKLIEEMLKGDSDKFNDELYKYINEKKMFVSKSRRKILPEYWVDLNLLGICSLAYDNGIVINVESDYIPDWVYKGDFDQKEIYF